MPNNISELNVAFKKEYPMKKIAIFILSALIIAGCSQNSEDTTNQKLNSLIVSYSKSIQSAPNRLSYSEITSQYSDSIDNFLWSNAPFVNWEGILTAIDTEEEIQGTRKVNRVECLIKTKISQNINGIFLLYFYENDNPLAFANLKECPIDSKIYFSFVPWGIKEDELLFHDIDNSKFGLMGGLVYIGTKPQLFSENTQRIIETYDSLRTINPHEYIRIEDSIPSVYRQLSEEERVFIDRFSSFRNIYDDNYPRQKAK